jgi:hypothetical protein
VRNEAASWEWTTYACWSGIWELVEQRADGDLCADCLDGTWDSWEDSCGNTSSLRVDCASAP